MEYSQIILEMLERIKVLENKVKALEDKAESAHTPPRAAVNLDKVSAKYKPLAKYLLASNEARITLTYSQIENILGFELPGTARKYKQSYWANTETHSYASSWLQVGYKTTRVSSDGDEVTFDKD